MLRSFYLRGGKRLFDIALAGMGLILFALPIVWIAWRIRWESGPPALFPQERIGFRGRPFTILKFRTLSDGKQLCSPFARRLRDTAMDELPQLINILKGEMSFVGPRPLIPEELTTLEQIPEGPARLQVRPGLTGWAQLNDTKVPALAQRVRWDLAYIRRCSLGLDLGILLRSVRITWQGAWEKKGSDGPGRI